MNNMTFSVAHTVPIVKNHVKILGFGAMEGRLNFTLPVASLKHLSTAKLGISFIYSALESDAFTIDDESSRNYDTLFALVKDISPMYYHRNDQTFFENWLPDILDLVCDEYDMLKNIFRQSNDILPPKEIFRHFRFTSRGWLDEVKTCQTIVADENYDLLFRFRLACKYYLEETICVLWKRMKPEDLLQIQDSHSSGVTFWLFKLQGLEDEMKTFLGGDDPDLPGFSLDALAFKRELDDGEHEYGAKYFFEKLNQAEKTAVLEYLNDANYVPRDILYYSFLSGSQLEMVLQGDGVGRLFFEISDPPYDDLILRMFESLRSFIDAERYFDILSRVALIPEYGHKVHPFELLWTHDQVPDSYRDYVLNQPGKDGVAKLLCRIFGSQRKDIRKVNIVLRYAVKYQLEIIFVGLIDRLHSLPKFLNDGTELTLLQICARKMISSKADLDFVRKASSTILDQEESWNIFLENVQGFLERANETELVEG